MNINVNAIEAPAFPNTLEEIDIDKGILLKLIVKTMLMYDTATPTQISAELRVSKVIVNALLTELQNLSLIESRGLAGKSMTAEIRYALTGAGNNFASDALDQSQYTGPAPVAFDAFREQMRKQSIAHERIHDDSLLSCLEHLVFPEYLINQLGPAVNSAKSILLYGEPGNGKTSIAEALGKTFKQTIYVPYCVEVAGHIINFFDTSVHTPVDGRGPMNNVGPDDMPLRSSVDQRWIACKRPVVMTGGELTLDMLDLLFNPYSKFYEAPLHLKAAGGVFIVDDFGRQRSEPQTILNRWIVPLERGVDYLTLHTGKKFAIPFDELVIFSTNIAPRKLVDEASLRRLYYKIHVPTPTKQDYIKIFFNECKRRGLTIEADLLLDFYKKNYEEKKTVAGGHHPKYLIDFVIASCDYRGVEREINEELLDYAWDNLHVH